MKRAAGIFRSVVGLELFGISNVGSAGLVCAFALVGCFSPDDPPQGDTDTDTSSGTMGSASNPSATATATASTTASGTSPTGSSTDPTTTTSSPSTTDSTTTSPTTTDPTSTTDPTTGDTEEPTTTGEPSDCPGGDPTPGEAPYLLTTVLTADGSSDVDVADINGDGNIDMISLSRTAGSVESFFGDGDGGFTSQGTVVLDGSGFPDRVRLGAIADDTVDLFVHMEGPVELMVARGDGTGGWPNPQIYTGTYIRAVDVGDVNGDDILDIAYVGATNLDVRLGQNTEMFSNPASFGANNGAVIRIADLTGDGNVDILTAEYNSNELQVLAGDGTGQFLAEPTLVTGSTITGVDVGNFDGDDELDLAVTTSEDLRVFYGEVGGGVSSTPGTVVDDAQFRVRVADIDADGYDDVVTRGGAFVEVRFSNGDQTFSNPEVFECAAFVTGLEIADINADCVPDLIGALGDGEDLCVLMSDRD